MTTENDTYSVALTFTEWMDVCHALGHTETAYRGKDMEGQANKYKAINEKITTELENNDE